MMMSHGWRADVMAMMHCHQEAVLWIIDCAGICVDAGGITGKVWTSIALPGQLGI